MADQDMPGEQKRGQVIRELRAWGVDLAGWALNLAIELLVARQRL